MNYTLILPENEFHDSRGGEREGEKKEHKGLNSPSRRQTPSHLQHLRSVAPSRWQNTSVKPTLYNTRSTQVKINSTPPSSPIHPSKDQLHPSLITDPQTPKTHRSDHQSSTDEYRLSSDLVLNPPKIDRRRR